jgi:hypothetical protein
LPCVVASSLVDLKTFGPLENRYAEGPKTLAEKFAGYFEHSYDGEQENERGRLDFVRLTNYNIAWAQVHGDCKDIAARARFVPYEHWPELHECCGIAIRETIANDKYACTPTSCAPHHGRGYENPDGQIRKESNQVVVSADERATRRERAKVKGMEPETVYGQKVVGW